MRPIPLMTLLLSVCLFWACPLKASSDASERKVIVLLAQFKNLPFSSSSVDFEMMLSQKGYSRGGSLGCAQEYLNAQLGGRYIVSFETAPIVTLPHDYLHYGMNDPFGKDMRPAEAAYDACKLSDEFVDFSEYDDIVIFYAGGSPADGSEDDDHLFPHNWTLSEAGLSLKLDGVDIDRYAMVPELMLGDGGEKVFGGMGLMCHEYAHTLGLIDMYDTDGTESGGVGTALLKTTSLMDRGMFNTAGCQPPVFNAIELEMLGIAEPKRLTPGSHILKSVGVSREFFRLDTENEGEYYLFECRSGDGWDVAAGQKGLIAYHIDRSDNMVGTMTAADRWMPRYNAVNAYKSHQCAHMLVLSDSFSPVSDPAFVAWDGDPSPLSINNIKILQDGSVSFDVSTPLVVDTADVYQDAVILRWHDVNAVGKSCFVKWVDEKGAGHQLECNPYGKGRYACTIEGLSPGCEYKFDIYVAEGFDYCTLNVTTWPEGGYPFIFLPSEGRSSTGVYARGSKLPLRVINSGKFISIAWYLDSVPISTGEDGYYTVVSSGRLKAVIEYEDGTSEVILKTLGVE